ncbi:MAG: NADH-quinone oxidoreductase subunit C [Campylobacterota bacterium]|nr:NADH-quinone oxidoreductase subunit C [Campylobacterota bacterium]
MIKRIDSTLEHIVDDIENFYNKKLYHFLTLNGVKTDENSTEIQWIFYKYGSMDEITMFVCLVDQNDIIPSVTHLLPNAFISQMEIVDMFGIKVEGSSKGLYLDEDSEQMPLSSCGV